jgi:hypothetical protein
MAVDTIEAPVPVLFSTSTQSPVETSTSPHPPGQTVDDLLNSLLGVTPTLPMSTPSQPVPPQLSHTVSAPPLTTNDFASHRTSRQAAHPAITKKSSRVGDATFAQAAQATSRPPPNSQTSYPPDPQDSAFPRQISSNDVSSTLLFQAFPAHNGSEGTWHDRSLSPNTRSQIQRVAMSEAAAVGAAQNGYRPHLNDRGIPDQVRKREFVQRLLELVHVSEIHLVSYTQLM